MQRTLFRRAAAGLVTTALATATLVAPPAPASAAFDGAEASASLYAGTGSGACTATTTPYDGGTPFSDNGVAVTHRASGTSTITNGGADVTTINASTRGTARSTAVGINAPATITGSGSATVSGSAALGTGSVCNAFMYASGGASAAFILPAPMWATISVATSGTPTATGGLSVYTDYGDSYVEVPARGSGSATVLLPAGEVEIDAYFSTQARPASTNPVLHSGSVSGSFAIRLAPVGHASAAKGKAKGTVVFGARSCSTGSIAGALTRKARKRATSVVVTVNGNKRAKFAKKKLKKRSFALPAARTAPATVVAKITLKSGKKLKVSRSYLAC